MMKSKQTKIKSIAFRYFKGPTGGPGGSNSVIETYNNQLNTLKDISFHYRIKLFNGFPLLRNIMEKLKFLSFFEKVYYSFTVINRSKRSCLFLVHDLESGYNCLKKKRKTILIYHQQGSLVAEWESLNNKKIPPKKKLYFQKLEKVVFTQAKRIIFTSIGARDSFLQTTSLGNLDKVKIEKNSEIIYNSCIVHKTKKKPKDCPEIDMDSLIFLSVTSLSHFKGVDRIPNILSEISRSFKIYWILVGSGHLENQIYRELEKYNLIESFYHFNEKLDQLELKYLYELADFYVMQHRISIFDLATLEAMSNSCVPFLSETGGNIEFNKSFNIVYNINDLLKLIENNQLNYFKNLNKDVFYEFFSGKALLSNLKELIQNQILNS